MVPQLERLQRVIWEWHRGKANEFMPDITGAAWLTLLHALDHQSRAMSHAIVGDDTGNMTTSY
jgi:hypothetical protein